MVLYITYADDNDVDCNSRQYSFKYIMCDECGIEKSKFVEHQDQDEFEKFGDNLVEVYYFLSATIDSKLS